MNDRWPPLTSEPRPTWTTPLSWVQIPVASLDYAALTRLAARRADLLIDRGSYGRSTYPMNLVGVLGEAAVQYWLLGLGYSVEWVAEDPSQGCDLRISKDPNLAHGIGLEVKTMQNLPTELTLHASQVDKFRSSAIVWCQHRLRSGIVNIAAWALVTDVRRNLEPTWDRHGKRMRVSSGFRRPAELGPWMESDFSS